MIPQSSQKNPTSTIAWQVKISLLIKPPEQSISRISVVRSFPALSAFSSKLQKISVIKQQGSVELLFSDKCHGSSEFNIKTPVCKQSWKELNRLKKSRPITASY